ncbi:MAG: 50S ribosomal protein L15 [Deltaproteobacteria bacterium]|nr:50S ribosomal protein L15 [Deltaproteobacteria bacterium]
MDLSRLAPAPGATKNRKRVGRGPGSGHGKTAGRGHKGRRSRSGGNTPPGYEGGQMPLQRRLPKRGFHNPFRVVFSVVNLGRLEELFESGATVDFEAMRSRGLVKSSKNPVKILAQGTLNKKLVVKAHKFSEAAKQRLEAAGGTAEVVARA